jgi:hypothetical protein
MVMKLMKIILVGHVACMGYNCTQVSVAKLQGKREYSGNLETDGRMKRIFKEQDVEVTASGGALVKEVLEFPVE